MTDYLDTKVTCQNAECGATFTMRLEREDGPFVCEKCGEWQQGEFPCPLCGGQTSHSLRDGNAWVRLDEQHDHSNDPEPEVEPEATESDSEEQEEQ